LGLIRTGNWRKLHSDELRDLYSSPNTIKVIKTNAIRIAGYVTHTKERRGGHKVSFFWGGRETERDNLKDLSVDGKIILEWILNKSVGKA
jgi:hypothetical protein